MKSNDSYSETTSDQRRAVLRGLALPFAITAATYSGKVFAKTEAKTFRAIQPQI
jgi:hypothetical protein